MLFLLPFQYTWAMVVSYDIHGAEDIQAHFGHHEHQATESHTDNIDLASDNEADVGSQAAQSHIHCGFLHLSCNELLSYDLPNFDPQTNQYSIQYLFNYHSPPANTLERPNWFVAV